MFRDVPRSWFYRRPRKTDKASVHALRSVHTRRQVAPTCPDDTSQRQIASCVLKNFCENLCLCNRFCRSNTLQKIKSDRICATCRGDKILLQRHEAICRCDVSPQHVAATSRRTCTHGVICRRYLLLQLVA